MVADPAIMSGKAAVERIKSNTDPFYATGVVMMARTKEDLRPTGEVFVGVLARTPRKVPTPFCEAQKIR